MNRISRKKGQLLAEVLLAVGLFSVTMASIGFLASDMEISMRASVLRTKALLLAREGLEAARSIRDDDFDGLIAGTYGATTSAGTWTFVPAGDATDAFDRTIVVSDIEDGVKKVESTVSWNVWRGRYATTTLVSYLSDWRQTGGDAGELAIDDSGALLLLGLTLTGITVENTSGSDVTISSMSVEWGGAEHILEITFDEDLVYSSVSGAVSGEEIDISDHVIGAGETSTIETIVFDNTVAETEFLITFIMDDGSMKYVHVTV